MSKFEISLQYGCILLADDWLPLNCAEKIITTLDTIFFLNLFVYLFHKGNTHTSRFWQRSALTVCQAVFLLPKLEATWNSHFSVSSVPSGKLHKPRKQLCYISSSAGDTILMCNIQNWPTCTLWDEYQMSADSALKYKPFINCSEFRRNFLWGKVICKQTTKSFMLHSTAVRDEILD